MSKRTAAYFLLSLFSVYQALLGSTVARICQLFPPLAKEGRVQRDPTQDSWTNYTLERVRWDVFSTTTTHHQVRDDTIDTCCDPRNAWPGFYVMQKTPPNPSQNSSPFYFPRFFPFSFPLLRFHCDIVVVSCDKISLGEYPMPFLVFAFVYVLVFVFVFVVVSVVTYSFSGQN